MVTESAGRNNIGERMTAGSNILPVGVVLPEGDGDTLKLIPLLEVLGGLDGGTKDGKGE